MALAMALAMAMAMAMALVMALAMALAMAMAMAMALALALALALAMVMAMVMAMALVMVMVIGNRQVRRLLVTNLKAYAGSLGAHSDIYWWLDHPAKKALAKNLTTESELEHIIDFFASDAAPKRLQKMSFKDAKRKAQEWSEANQKKGRDLIDGNDDLEVIHDFGDGTRIVRLLTKNAYQREGFLMSQCVGGYDPNDSNCHIYSYRDADNMPHATFEVRKECGEIVQIKGKGNGPIHPKYIHPILEFLRIIDIEPKPREMKYLGYYHIDKSHIGYLKQFDEAWKQVTEINGEYYAVG